jgi:NAD(P)-dependent dehydrogenase (short-subunit alcohol dehydrogenase family)
MIRCPLAIVTGAGRGIGKAVALGLAQDGYKTILVSRTRGQLESVAREIKEKNDTGSDSSPFIYKLDITKHDSIHKLVGEVFQLYGRIDVLVNNAGLWISGSINISAKEFQKLLDINLKSAFYFMKEVIPIMQKQGKGYIFNISSRSGKIGFIDSGAYSATKFGLVGMSESLHRELAPQGIKVTCICPGWVDTMMAQEAKTTLQKNEMIQPDDIMKTLRWLLNLSPAASVKDVLIECRKNIA